MKKIISAAIVCIFVCVMSLTAFAAKSPVAPTINTTRPTTAPTTVQPTQEPTSKDDDKTSQKPGEDDKTTDKDSSTTDKGDVDDVTTTPDDATSTTKNDVTSDKGPSSPETGSYFGKSVSAAALVALALGGAAVYTSKKKVTE